MLVDLPQLVLHVLELLVFFQFPFRVGGLSLQAVHTSQTKVRHEVGWIALDRTFQKPLLLLRFIHFNQIFCEPEERFRIIGLQLGGTSVVGHGTLHITCLTSDGPQSAL